MMPSSGQPPLGFTFAGVHAGIKKTGAADLAVIASDRPCTAAAVFTQNSFPAAPVLYDRALLSENRAALRAIAINAGCANACTGEAGLLDAAQMALAAETALDLPERSAAVMSTGVIGPRLPMERIVLGLANAARGLSPGGWDAASRAIMTTDTRPKVAFRQVGGVRLFGMCKGAGMIHPNMATMLAAIVTDAAVAPSALAGMLGAAVAVSFNAISIDGDTSTNDTVLVMANGASGVAVCDDLSGSSGTAMAGDSISFMEFADVLTGLCVDLAHQIVHDGEGATKFVTICVEGASSDTDAMIAAKAVARSPLVKTAFYGGDANWGRILAAVGYSGAVVDPHRTDLWIAAGTAETLVSRPGATGIAASEVVHAKDGDGGRIASLLQLVRQGQPLPYSEKVASAIFEGTEITVVARLGLGDGQATVWTCDLGHGYVDINGHYRT